MRQTFVLSATACHVPSRNSASRFFSGFCETVGDVAMLLCLACGGAAGGLCFAIAVWRLNAARYPDQVYRAAAVAPISAVLTAALLLDRKSVVEGKRGDP